MQKLKLRPNSMRLPLGGHHFKDGAHLLTGDSAEEVVDKIIEYRLINGRPIGKPLEELIRYYAQKFPWMVMVDEEPEIREKPVVSYERWRQFVVTVWKTPPTSYTAEKEAKMRHDVCKDCPFNSEVKWKKTPECLEAEKRAFLIRRGMKVDPKIGFCTCHGADIGIASLFERSDLIRFANPKANPPANCWLKGTTNEPRRE